jgi:dTDP-4-dehydrorhamnose reductase
MSLLLLGARGQVGWELQRALAPLGPVTALGSAEADFADPDGLARLVAGRRPAWVVNAAAYTGVDAAEDEPEAAERVNATAVAALARGAAEAGAWLVHYSTDYVFDGAKGAPYAEDDDPAPLGVYGRTKLAGEQAVRQAGPRHLVFRTQWVYARRRRNFARTILGAAAKREALQVVSDQIGAPTSAELIADVTAHAIAQVARAGKPDDLAGLYHLAAGGETSWHGFAQHLVAGARQRGAALACTPEAVAAIPTADWPTKAPRPLDARFDTARLCRTFGLAMPDWRRHADRLLDDLYGEAS